MRHCYPLLVLCLWPVFSLFVSAEPPRPNIVVFIADDVSWDDFGYAGNPDVKTPHIDDLAARGIRFDQVYLTTSSCSPTRNSIMAGRYPHNTGAAELHTQPPADLLAFPEVLHEHGYFTGQAGKFHMGENVERGFDVMYRSEEEIGDGGEAGWLKLTRERPRDQPFFFWLAARDAHRGWGPNAFSGTHDPASLSIPDYLVDRKGTCGDLAHYYDEITRFDQYIGLVLAELKRQDVLENTLVIVMADNGRPFPHSKTRLNDRGIKTPFILHWPARVSSPAVSQALISVIDIAPTFLELAGAMPGDNFQGHSFVSLIDHPERAFRQHVFAEHNWHDYEAHERMVRKGSFLYIRNYRPNRPQLGPADSIGSPAHADLVDLKKEGKLSPIQADLFIHPRPHEELYDLVADPRQRVNVASLPKYYHVLEDLRVALDRWMEETADSVPEDLTPDWYLPEPGYHKTEQHGIRGTMPGVPGVAIKTTKKGPF